MIILGGKSDNEYNGKTYLLSLKDNTIEEFNSKITFNITYEFEESRMKCVNEKSFIQVGVDEKGNRNLVSFYKNVQSIINLNVILINIPITNLLNLQYKSYIYLNKILL